MRRVLSGFLVVVIFAFIIWSLVEFTLDNDISLQLPIDTASLGKLPDQKIWLISYADGNDIHIKNQNFLSYSALNQGIDVIINYHREHIDPEFYKKNEKILSYPRGSGYWLWKPYFILQTLNSMPENDILIYVDSGFIINGNLKEVIDLTNKYNMVIFRSHEHKLKTLTKRDAVVKMGMDNLDLSNYQISASIIIMKNVGQVRNFIEEWLFYSEDPEILTDIPSINEEYEDFKDHRHDQSILSLLYYRHQNYGFYIYPLKNHFIRGDVFYYHHRRNSDDLYNNNKSLEENSSLALWKDYTKSLDSNDISWHKKIRQLITKFAFEICSVIDYCSTHINNLLKAII